MADSAREAILRRIQKATSGSSVSLEAVEAEWRAIPRSFRRAPTRDRQTILELFIDRLHDYDAQVVETDAQGTTAAIARCFSARGVRRLVISEGLPPGLLPQGLEFVTDTGLSSVDLDGFDGVLTLATVGIAETGSLVLQTTPGQGRRAATLVPDYHLCVVHTGDVVESVPEAIARLEPTATLSTTFVSGPSATADIEMTRIKGVHGPRFLDVVLVSEA